jgi:membrane-bound lytic murein transglycosylase A
LAPAAPADLHGFRTRAAAGWLIALLLALLPASADSRTIHSRSHRVDPQPRPRLLPYPALELPVEIPGSQYVPISWRDVTGWSDDDHLAAYRTFRTSCQPIVAQNGPPAESKALGTSLRDPCRIARSLELPDGVKAKAFFEENFLPLRISRLGEGEGFVTGYYEPVIEGSRTENEIYNIPVYRRPSNLFVKGYSQASASLPNKGAVYRKIGRRKLVPYYDRAEIEDGKIEGRGLEIAYLKNQTDLLFAQIQGSARIELADGSIVRINYDAHNGYPYTPVGRILIDRGIIPREQMSMQKIREWMEQNPDGANELRRQNRSYIFFREVNLAEKDEPVGAQGVPLTAGRSIAVDKALHVYGTPFFIEGDLPIESERAKTPFRRLMIAQDTGSAIVGPARADLYFGAGVEAGRVAGRLKNNARFVILIPRELDPVARGRRLPVPDERPSAKIAKLFPQTDPLKDQPRPATGVAPATVTPTTATSAQASIPLPTARPKEAPLRAVKRRQARGR